MKLALMFVDISALTSYPEDAKSLDPARPSYGGASPPPSIPPLLPRVAAPGTLHTLAGRF